MTDKELPALLQAAIETGHLEIINVELPRRKEPMSTETYKIRRFYGDGRRRPRTIKTGLTLEQAQEHCQREDTHNTGDDVPLAEQWFDGYDREA